jgi:hypothetical protein
LLLDSSPTPQLLLSENNIIVYANNSAARVLRVKHTDETGDDKKEENQEEASIRDMETEEDDEQFDKPKPTGLEGRTIDQLNIEIADENIRRWLSLIQVFENIKLHLSKREAHEYGTAELAEMYGEGPKYTSYDYYGDEERSRQGNSIHADSVMRDTAPIVIEREDGERIPATMYVSIIDPYNTGYSYSAISLIPGKIGNDATFTSQLAVQEKRTRRRDKIREKLHRHHSSGVGGGNQVAARATGKSGENMVDRVREIKDLILDEMEYCFIALSPDGDIVITNSATKAVLGQETLQASIGFVKSTSM